MSRLPLTRRATMLSAALLAAGVLFLSPASAQEPKRGGTLVVGSTQMPRHLNGAVQSGVATANRATAASARRARGEWNMDVSLQETGYGVAIG